MQNYRVTAQPAPRRVAGADSAAFATATYTDKNGIAQDELILTVLRGQTIYTVRVLPTSDYRRQNNDLLLQVIASFAFTSAAPA